MLFQGTPGSWTLFFPRHHGTSNETKGPFDAVVIGSDRRLPVDPELTVFLTTNRTRFDRVDLSGGITVWLPPSGSRLDSASGGFSITNR